MGKQEEIKFNVLRGGSWFDYGWRLHASVADRFRPFRRYYFLGFRLVAREVEYGKSRKD